MFSHLGVHRYTHPVMQVPYVSQKWDSSVHFRGLGCSRWGKVRSASDKDQKIDFKLQGRFSLRPSRVSQGIHAHLGEGIGSKILFYEAGRSSFLRAENTLPRGFTHHTDGARPVYLAGAGDCKWTLFSSSQDSAFSNHLESTFVCDAEFSTTKMDDSLQGSVVSVNTQVAADFGRSPEVNDSSCFRIPRKPFAPLGWLSLGLCGNALIMRVGSDARCFHHQGIFRGLVDLGEHTSCNNTFYAPTDVKALGRSCSRVGGTSAEFNSQKGVSLFQGKPIATSSQDDNSRGRQNKQKKAGKAAALTRDLYERSSFHLLELLFYFPFLDPNAATSNFRIPPRKSLKELANILNRTAIGLAGVSATWVLFVGSRILWLDMSLNKRTIASLAIGFWFLLLSWAVKRVSELLICLADIYSRSKAFQQDYITSLQKELQCIALKSVLLVVMCFMGGG